MNEGEVTLIGFAMGHKIVYVNNVWYVEATGEPYSDEVGKKLACTKCNLYMTEEGHDPCIANLPNVDYACCGHGVLDEDDSFEQAYIAYSNGDVVRFKTTDDILKYIKDNE